MSIPPSSGVLAAEIGGADWLILAAVVVLFLLSIVLGVAETALTRISKAKAQALAETHGRKGEILVSLVEHQEWLNPVLFVVLSTQLVQSTLLGVVASRLLGGWGVVGATVLNVTLFFVVAEVAPKTWAIQNTDRAALAAARPVKALAGLAPLRLLSRALIGLTNVLLPGKGLKRGPYTSEEELLAVADLAVEEAVIEEAERDLIESVIELGDTVVREVMVPRPDMVTVTDEFRVADAMEVVILNGLSRIPICGAGIDDIVGVVYAKDLMRAERDGHEDRLVRELGRPAHFVPETKGVAELLREMQRERFHMALVVDEYGGTAGLITLEDIIEELLGEIVDEFDLEDPMVEVLPDGDHVVNARLPLDEANELLGAHLPEGDWDTIGGLLLSELGRVPADGESVVVGPWELTALRVQGRRIGRVRVHRVAPIDADIDDVVTADEAG
ncbi:MAG: hemolysin family protein [Actinomycetota bacterium]|nr:hemolysin family protein [Actinomycetota bacterium]